MSFSFADLSEVSVSKILQSIVRPNKDSHKGQNGKALIIGGSDLFHAASQWSFQAASRWVDMLLYASIRENNEIIQKSKIVLKNGVVVPRAEIENYLSEVSAVLLGPGMRRDFPTRFSQEELERVQFNDLTVQDLESDTTAVTAALLHSAPQKKWILDAGALQVLEPNWLPKISILTPHPKEFSDLLLRWQIKNSEEILESIQSIRQVFNQPSDDSRRAQVFSVHESREQRILSAFAGSLNTVILLKGREDVILHPEGVMVVSGGNAGLTKGGTGDVLAGLLLGFLATSNSLESALAASVLMKQSGHDLFLQRREMFNATDVVEQLPVTYSRMFSL